MATTLTTIKLRNQSFSIDTTLAIPTQPATTRQMLPALCDLTDAIIQAAIKVVEAEGRTVSCKAGCGACCRQLVPITEPEAHRIAHLVADLPEPRRTEILHRFTAAYDKLTAAGLLDTIQNESSRDIYLAYFAQKIPCPFLENESCSIYAERPIVCREFLVTSDPVHCQNPAPKVITRVGLPGCMTVSVARTHASIPNDQPANNVPLITALLWSAQNPEPPATRSGKEILNDVLARLTRTPVREA